MKSSAKNIKLTPVDDLFSSEESRADANRERVVELPLAELHPFRNHPFKVLDDEKMADTAQSIREHGVLVPAIVRPREEGGYEIVSGHRRHHASQIAGLDKMPAIIRDLDDDATTIIMVDSNLQRESILPSERAWAYAAYYLKHIFTGEESIIGCLFSLGRTDYEKPSANIAIYGHHMRRSRSTTMFQPLHNFKNADYRHSHATIYLDTLYENRTYTVFAVINKRERDWDAAVADFTSMEQYQAFLNRAKEWSLYDTGVPVTTNDRILTLITCDRGYHPDDGQLVVMAVEQ